MTAPTITPSTTPPATMLSKKFLREGEIPGPAASATSGITMEAVRAAAVNPVTAFSLSDDRTWSFALALDEVASIALEDLKGKGLKKASELGGSLLWLAEVNGVAIETAEVDAISPALTQKIRQRRKGGCELNSQGVCRRCSNVVLPSVLRGGERSLDRWRSWEGSDERLKFEIPAFPTPTWPLLQPRLEDKVIPIPIEQITPVLPTLLRLDLQLIWPVLPRRTLVKFF
uniref:Uncharacterized protein n=1 Tax=Nelumbo nucifera TaxID=4432 RepID=A0A822ZLP2_NELNU|nr:TPA_asm: hypothetical protein HUJ06_002539 [Nelumbo nucifera]